MDAKLRSKVDELLGQHRIMTIATLRPDGWPQATTLTLWFLCGLQSQKARNLALDNRVSCTIDHDTPDIMAIKGLSMAARAHPVRDRREAQRVLGLLASKYTESSAVRKPMPMSMPAPEDVAVFRVEPEVISVLDYTKGFGHTELVTLPG
jgi:hypothetical protein